MIKWQDFFSQLDKKPSKSKGICPDLGAAKGLGIDSIDKLKGFLDLIHIKHCLARPYQKCGGSYPIVEPRELVPSFDNPMFEYKQLPGFSMVAFERELKYFDEQFQYDILYPLSSGPDVCTIDRQVTLSNMQTLTSRIPRVHLDLFRSRFAKVRDFCQLSAYEELFEFLLNMDRAHLLSIAPDGTFQLSGIYASFPNSINAALKTFGLRIGKFKKGDHEMYDRNRLFVYQFLMELYGFPIASERRTSSAMFAKKLAEWGERFLLRVLGQTDRTITTYTSDHAWHPFPKIEKTAIVSISKEQSDLVRLVDEKGFFFDGEKRAVILRVVYRQHRYDPTNLRRDRAISVVSQEIIHPLTGEILSGLNVLKDATNMHLRLNDIVKGEYTERVIFRRTEIIEDTKSHENRLKALCYWISKHQRRMIDYSDDFFSKVNKILSSYLYSPKNDEVFEPLRDLHHEVSSKLGYIIQARRVRVLEDLSMLIYKGEHVTRRKCMQLALENANDLKFEAVSFFPEIVEKIVACLDSILSNRYLVRTYITPSDGKSLSKAGMEIRKNYGALVSISDYFRTRLKARSKSAEQSASIAK